MNNEYPRSNFDAPYLVTWYCTIWNILYLPVYLMIHAYIISRRSKSANNPNETSTNNSAGSSAISNNPFGSNISNKTSGSRDGTTSTTDTSSTTSLKKVLV